MLTIRTLTLSVVLVLVLALASSPVLASPPARIADTLETCSNKATSFALGVEGGFLSLMSQRSNPGLNPVAEIIQSRGFTICGVQNVLSTYIAYVRSDS